MLWAGKRVRVFQVHRGRSNKRRHPHSPELPAVAAEVACVGELQLVRQAHHVAQRLSEAQHVDKLAAQLCALGLPAFVAVVRRGAAPAYLHLLHNAGGAVAAGVAGVVLVAGEDVAGLLIVHRLLLKVEAERVSFTYALKRDWPGPRVMNRLCYGLAHLGIEVPFPGGQQLPPSLAAHARLVEVCRAAAAGAQQACWSAVRSGCRTSSRL